MTRVLPFLLALLLLPPLAGAQEAQGDTDSPDTPVATAPAPPRVDALGRPFPGPAVLARSKGWIVGGAALSATGGAALVTGLFLGSSVARGEFSIGEPGPTGAVFGALFGTGAVLLAAGIPLVSAGSFSTAQLNRTIKGAEKVPRVVANEARYWNFYLQRQVGQGLTVSGGGAILLGVVATAGAAAIVGTEYYKPEIWAGVAGSFGGGAAILVLGVLLQKDADKRMDALRHEVDPYYQQSALPPRLRPFHVDPRQLVPRPTGTGLALAFRF